MTINYQYAMATITWVICYIMATGAFTIYSLKKELEKDNLNDEQKDDLMIYFDEFYSRNWVGKIIKILVAGAIMVSSVLFDKKEKGNNK